MTRSVLLAGLALALAGAAEPAEEPVLRSSRGGTSLLELYSSEGCSSCPPADSFVSSLLVHKGLWKDFVPVAFHVTYWDYLGWKDVLASPAFTARQRAYGRLVTPELLLNGRPLRIRSTSMLTRPRTDAGALEVRPKGLLSYRVAFSPRQKGRWVAHAALLGFNLVHRIDAGENVGRSLRHDFAALGYQSEPLVDGAALITITPNLEAKPGSYGVAVWISRDDDPAPVQAAGGPVPGPT